MEKIHQSITVLFIDINAILGGTYKQTHIWLLNTMGLEMLALGSWKSVYSFCLT